MIVSRCCKSPLRFENNVLPYYICTKCELVCDTIKYRDYSNGGHHGCDNTREVKDLYAEE